MQVVQIYRKIIKILFRILFKLIFRVEVIGLKNYFKSEKKTIIIANYSSFLNPIILNLFLPDELIFAIHPSQNTRWWEKILLRLIHSNNINLLTPNSSRTIINLIKENKKIVIFPEVKITSTESLMKIYEEPAKIAEVTNACILPIGIFGSAPSLFSKTKSFCGLRLFPKITLNIRHFQKIKKSQPSHNRKVEATTQLYDIMSNMLFESYKYQNNLFQALINSAKKFGFRKKIVSDINNLVLSYKKLIISAIIIAKKLPVYSNNIGLLIPNTSSAIIAFYAIQYLQKIPTMLNYTAGKLNILYACQIAHLTHIITSREFIAKANLEEIINELEANKLQIIYLEDLKTSINQLDKFTGFIRYLIITSYLDCKTDNKNTLNKPAVILFTSGSEGQPKAVVLSHKNIQSNIAQTSSRIDLTPKDLFFNALPIFHCYGLTAGTLLPIMLGIKIYLYPTPLHYRIIPELVYNTGATIFFGTNTFLNNYAKYAHPYDFYSTRYVIAGAEKLKPETQKIWSEKFGIRILEGYGVTETTPIISLNTPIYYKAGTVGRFLPGIKYKLRKVDGIIKGEELLVSGPNIMIGYILHNLPNKIIRPKNKYHSTGDIVEIDSEGFITILGRIKRFAKIAGEMISLTIIEEIINANWPNYNHAVISIEDYNKGEKLVIVTEQKDLTLQKITKQLKESGLSKLYIPKELFFLEKIPIFSTGKNNYPALIDVLKSRLR
jgi:acyl-[acyl-carrier-protein]-phospholipid O-acyltransferase/long-chain-fatty-acid--[acyl-carrier-protein] ligase